MREELTPRACTWPETQRAEDPKERVIVLKIRAVTRPFAPIAGAPIRLSAVSSFRLTQPAIKLNFCAQENHPDDHPGFVVG
jgi:hypothetical protein